MATKTRLDVHIRWMIRRDIPEVLEIEQLAFEFPWTEEEFMTVLRKRNSIGMVAVIPDHKPSSDEGYGSGPIVGYMVYELLKSQIHVLNFAVEPQFQLRGIGSRMFEKLVNKLSHQRRQEITLEVRESNLDAQLFFRRQGFMACRVLHGHYEDTDEDAYTMSFQWPHDPVALGSNRKNISAVTEG